MREASACVIGVLPVPLEDMSFEFSVLVLSLL